MYLMATHPQKGDIILYDNGGKDIGQAGTAENVMKYRKKVLIKTQWYDVRFVAKGALGNVWVITEPIGPNQYDTRSNARGFHL